MAPLARELHARARTASHHQLGKDATIGAAQQAAISPAREQVREAATATVEQLNNAKTENLQREELKRKLSQAVNQEMHQAKTEDEAKRVMNEGAARASATLRGGLEQEREAATGGLRLAAKTDVPADKQHAPEKAELHVEAAGPQLGPVEAGPAVPPPLPAAKLDCSSDRAPTDQLLGENQVTTEQLQEGNDPAFAPALNARADAERHEAAAAPAYRREEGNVRAAAQVRAEVAVQGGLNTMHGIRGGELGKVGLQQYAVRAADAAKRTQITDQITQIKDTTKADVELILNHMDIEAGATFDAGLQRASDAYEAVFSEEKGGIGTWLTTWGSSWDRLIERALGKAKRAYMAEVDKSIDAVATIIDNSVREAKARVVRGRREVDDVVKRLGGDMRGFGEQAKAAVAADFGAMESHIDERRDGLINKLSEQLKASYQQMSAREEELREANKSLWKRAYDATVGAVKKIIEFKNLLFSVLAKAAAVIADIIAHPIRFLGSLVSAVGQGLKNFIDKIGTHLQKGLMDWLFGALAGAGLKLPEKLDLQGIISIVLQVLGLTYENFRARAVNILGEPLVAALEKGAEVFMIFMREGVGGIWRFIKERVSDLKSMVLDAIFNFIKDKVIIAGITWIIGLLNPASAFFKACKAIYDIIVFVVNRASQIIAFVSAVVDSVAAIAAGSLGTAIAAVEGALARSIPVAIGFLASLLGLGDPSKPVRETIDKARSPINKAIDWVIRGAVKLAKAAGKLVKSIFGKQEEAAAGEKPDAGKKAAPESVKQAIATELAQNLSQDHTLEQARVIVSGTAKEFKSLGVSRILVAPPDKEGNSAIVVEMSPGEEIAYLTPRGAMKGRAVHLNVELVLNPAPGPSIGPLPGIVAGADKPARDRRKYDYLQSVLAEEGSARVNVPVPREGRSPGIATPVGGMIFPLSGGRIRLMTWNTGTQAMYMHENETHAERQFLHWLEQMVTTDEGKGVLARVTGIEAHLRDYSPCDACSGLFPKISEKLPNATSKRLFWYEQYPGTSAQALRTIAGAGWWLGAPGGEIPEGSAPVHLVNRLQRKQG